MPEIPMTDFTELLDVDWFFRDYVEKIAFSVVSQSLLWILATDWRSAITQDYLMLMDMA